MHDIEPIPLDADWWTSSGNEAARQLLVDCLTDPQRGDWTELFLRICHWSGSPALFAALPHMIAALERLPPDAVEVVLAMVGCSIAPTDRRKIDPPPESAEPYRVAMSVLREQVWSLVRTNRSRQRGSADLGALAALEGHPGLAEVILLHWTGEEVETVCPSCGEYGLFAMRDGLRRTSLSPSQPIDESPQPGNRREHEQLLATGHRLLTARPARWTEKDLIATLAVLAGELGDEQSAVGLLYLAGDYRCPQCGNESGLLEARLNT